MDIIYNLIKNLENEKINEEKRRSKFDSEIETKYNFIKNDLSIFKLEGIMIKKYLEFLDSILKPRLLFNLLENDKICINLSLNLIKQIIKTEPKKKLDEKEKDFILFLKRDCILEFKNYLSDLEKQFDIITSIEIYEKNSFLVLRDNDSKMNAFSQKNYYIKNYLDDVRLLL